jgi:hypothetical protein
MDGREVNFSGVDGGDVEAGGAGKGWEGVSDAGEPGASGEDAERDGG